LSKGEIARVIQLGVIEAGLAEGVTARGNKKNDRAQAFLSLARTYQLHELGGFVHEC
jgi:hypothetical protein